MIDATTTITETPEPDKKSRGNPNWRKKQEDEPQLIRADVVNENIVNDIWEVKNKDPKLHYTWARKSQDYEMNMLAQKGYVPARGNEKILGDPFTATQDTTGQTKERGDRILMACPIGRVVARRAEQAGRHVNVKKSSENDARKMRQKGVAVESLSSSETRRESIPEV